MKTTKEQNFERELPQGYKEAMYINAKNAKFGIIFNAIALVVMVIVMAVAVLSLVCNNSILWPPYYAEPIDLMIACGVLLLVTLAYVILHELVHGCAYKTLTGEELTFGISWSCAFCGVPNIFTYRRTMLIAVLAPFVTFTLIFIPLLIILYTVSPIYYFVMAFVFGMHLGGCAGDLYVSYLLMTKFKDAKTLLRDTGPEQFFYVPGGEE